LPEILPLLACWPGMTQDPDTAAVRLECLAELAQNATPDERRRLERLLELARRASVEGSGHWERTVEIVIQAAVRRSRLPPSCID
jgi:hypothetical protein